MDGIAGYARYALYWVPEPGPLADFGAAWLGWDAARGAEAPHPEVPGLPASVAAITAEPRKYGLHATIKAPFRLAEGRTAAALHAAAADLCARLAPAEAEGLRIGAIGPWLALLPEGDPARLNAVAAAVVEGLDAFRAAPTAAETARRRPETLTPRQRALLDRWGYPYVMEEFFFHVTLSGPLGDADRTAVQAALDARIGPMLPRPFRLDRLALCGEGADGRFRVLHRYTLSG